MGMLYNVYYLNTISHISKILWNDTIMKYEGHIEKETLKQYQNLTLDEKIEISKDIIREFGENKIKIGTDKEVKTYISSSFGKDSLTTINLVREVYPEIPVIFVDTGVEQPSTVKMSKEYPNTIIIKPKKEIKEIIEKYGYMIPIGKERADAIEACRRNLHEGKFNTNRVKKMRGDYGEKSFFNFSKYQSVLLAPFKISNKCTHYLKVEPFNRLKREGWKYSITGVTAEESNSRKSNIIKNGFITVDQCRPIGHWTEQDVLEYILRENIQLPSCYGEIKKDKNGKLHTTQFVRTGCICCPIGSQHNKPNDFQRMWKYDKDSWNYVINELGYKQVLDYFNIPYHDEYWEENKIPEDEKLDSYLN